MAITIKEVSDKKALKEFAAFPADYLYRNHPYYVPQLISDTMGSFTPTETRLTTFARPLALWLTAMANR